MRNATIAVAVWVGLTGPVTAQELAPQNASITQADMRADLYFIASDDLRGRLTETSQNRIAADFIKARFERLGLEPAGTGDSFGFSYDLVRTALGAENRLTIRGLPGYAETPLRPGAEYYPLRFSGSAQARGSLVFMGFGIVSPSRAHDDYGPASMSNRIVMVLDHEPGEADPSSVFDGLVTSEASRDLRKALYAQERGAAGVIFVADVHNHAESLNAPLEADEYWPARRRRVERYMLASWVDRVRIPVIRISPRVADTLLRRTGRTLEGLARSSERPGGVAPLDVPGPTIEMAVAVDRQPVPDRSILAAIRGADPAVRDEWVIISAHFDHNGADGRQVYNGADDDGSGTVALLDIAEAYVQAAAVGMRPRRSILFAAWNSEERGLLGAWAFTESPTFPLQNVVAVLNLDMIGRNEEVPFDGGRRFRGLDPQSAESNANAVNILGTTYSADLRAVIERANAEYGLDVRFRYDNNASNLLRRSDHWPFLQHGVPAVFVHTGLHPDYHTPGDRPEKINYVKMEKIARLVHQVSWDLAQLDVPPRFNKVADPVFPQ